jgi:alpha-1,3-rhamnosyl/mannosyltransferase
MKIAIDAGCLGITDKNLQVGVYQVAINLLLELGKIDQENTYLLYSFYPISSKLLKSFGLNFKNVVVHPTRGWMKIWLPLQLLRDKADIFLGLSQALPLKFSFQKYKTIGFIYDVAFEKYPKMYPDSRKKLLRQTDGLLKHANHIITISKATENDLIAKYNIAKSKVSVIYPGVRSLIHRTNSGQVKMTDFTVKNDTPYFLFVGALKRIKNVSTLIKAFDRFLENNKEEYYLYIVGGKKWYDGEIDVALVSLKQKEKIKFLDFVDDETLASLYKGATAFISPSIYEGFGLPFVEAMASGCLVIGSTAGAIPEVVGDAGILVDAYDVDAIAHAMEKIAHDKNLRNTLRKRGLEQAKQFNWEKFAKEVLAVINTV